MSCLLPCRPALSRAAGLGLVVFCLSLSACNKGDGVSSLDPDEILGDPPAAPSGLKGSVQQDNVVSLVWEDNADDEHGFILERRLAPGEFVPIARAKPDETSYLDDQPGQLRTYEYRVYAFNNGGSSDYSEVIVVETREAMWARSYGGPATEQVRDILPLKNGSEFVFASNTDSFGNGGSDAWLVKVDSFGDVAWEFAVGTAFDESVASLAQLNNGNIVVCGSIDTSADVEDVWIFSLSPEGQIVWQQSLGDPARIDLGLDVLATSDGGCLVCGMSFLSDIASDAWVLKLDAQGNVQWQNRYGTTGFQSLTDAFEDPVTGYMVVGTDQMDSEVEDIDAWALCLDFDGNMVWEYAYGSGGVDIASKVLARGAESFTVFGTTDFPNTEHYWAFELAIDGNVLWQKAYSIGMGHMLGGDILRTRQGGALLAGISQLGGRFPWVVSIDAAGDPKWQKQYREPSDNSLFAIAGFKDSSFLMGGSRVSGLNGSEAWLLRVNPSGDLQFSPRSGANTVDTSIEVTTTQMVETEIGAAVTPTSFVPVVTLASVLITTSTSERQAP